MYFFKVIYLKNFELIKEWIELNLSKDDLQFIKGISFLSK